MSIDTNNSSLNNLFGSFLNINSINNTVIDFQEDINTICIDSSLNRIGINTLDPTCSLDISGNDGKIQVNSISCENIDISDGNLRMFSLPNIDNSVNYGLYVDINGFIKIRIDGQY